jgi:hypothetical protein
MRNANIRALSLPTRCSPFVFAPLLTSHASLLSLDFGEIDIARSRAHDLLELLCDARVAVQHLRLSGDKSEC